MGCSRFFPQSAHWANKGCTHPGAGTGQQGHLDICGNEFGVARPTASGLEE